MTAQVLGVGGSRPRSEEGSRSRSNIPGYAWKPVGWFGLLFLIIGVADMALVWYPLRPGNPSWEFGAIDLSFSTLPLLTIGLGASLAAAIGRGRARMAMFYAILSVLMGLVCLGGYLIFLSDVPLALRNSPPEVLTGVKKAIFRNTVFGVAFTSAFIGTGVAVLRNLKAFKKDGPHGS